jgi:hypothetical protein
LDEPAAARREIAWGIDHAVDHDWIAPPPHRKLTGGRVACLNRRAVSGTRVLFWRPVAHLRSFSAALLDPVYSDFIPN